jgi:pimeloyl-ACP methyl ester carboxylesterase
MKPNDMSGPWSQRTLKANGLSFSAYELGEGPLVLCLHGFPDHPLTFHHQLTALAQAGYRVIAPRLRGYEPSSQPKSGGYDAADLGADVLGWLDDLGERRAHIIGHDWGSMVAYMAAALAPERIQSLVGMSAPHPFRLPLGYLRYPGQLRRSWYVFLFQLSRVSDARMPRDDFQLLEELWRTWSPTWQVPAEHLERVKETFRQPGVISASQRYYRAFFKPWTAGGRKTWSLLKRPTEVPTLAITGAKDGAMDTRLYEFLLRQEKFPAGLRLERLPEAGHFPHLEQPESINALLLEWLGQHRGTAAASPPVP